MEPLDLVAPIAWLWSTLHRRVFGGDDLTMALFGWELFLAPVVFVLGVVAVLRGATTGLRRPPRPEGADHDE